VVPGNPGCAAFYATFAKTLCDELDAVRVDVVGYLGHTEAERRGRSEWFSLDEQKTHVCEYIDRCCDDEGPEPVVVVGHSIGAHLALHAMSELGFDRVSGVVGLMPFLHVNTQSTLQSSLSFVTRLSVVVHALGRFLDALRFVAPGVRLALLKNTVTKSMDSAAADITSAWLRWQSLINMVFMGRTEFAQLTTPVSECALVRRGADNGRFVAVYAHDDHWAPFHQRDALAALDVGVFTVDDLSVKHDFVVNDAAAELVAKQTAKLAHRF
jgi:pimeloyl-ACP methyl ester carboxylesterase|tara:strand:+ start:3153 stop:3959 length:807 start_codon:yes stop_codon:yes gene_type:complete